MCVDVDSMGGFNHCVFFSIFIAEQQKGFRLQRLKEGLNSAYIFQSS